MNQTLRRRIALGVICEEGERQQMQVIGWKGSRGLREVPRGSS